MFFLCTYVFRKICTPQVGPRGQGWDGNEVKAELANSDCSVHGLHEAGAMPPLGPASHTNRMSNWGQVPDVYKRGENRSWASRSARSRRCASTPSLQRGPHWPGRGEARPASRGHGEWSFGHLATPVNKDRDAGSGPRAPTSSSRRRCSFCCSIRFCLSASSCLLYSSCSLSCCSCRSCCRLRASERSLFSCCSLRKSRRSVDSPGTLTMELQEEAGL